MGWRGRSVRDQRVEFVIRAGRGESLSGLCREYGISRPTGYVWLRRFQQEGIAGIEERNRRPHHSPAQTRPEMEERIEHLRRQRPDWGARKLSVLLAREGIPLPVITVHRVLQRRGLVSPRKGGSQARLRFEREAPNQLWAGGPGLKKERMWVPHSSRLFAMSGGGLGRVPQVSFMTWVLRRKLSPQISTPAMH